MSTILDQELIPLREAASIIPTRPHIATIWRWIERGARGHKLESWLVGGQRFTTRDAIESFLGKINGTSKLSSPSTPKARQRQIDAAEKELEEMGI